MNGRIFFSVILSILLLFSSGSALGIEPLINGSQINSSLGSSPGANLQWFVEEIDTDGDTGLHASVAYDPTGGYIYISYYDATNQQLRMARSDGKGLACGPNGTWGCLTLDSGADVGKYNSIAINPKTGGIGIAYHDATNGNLKYITFENPRLLVYVTHTIDKGVPGISTTGLHTSLKYNEDGKPFIAYYFDNPTPGGADALMVAYDSITNGDCGYGSIENTWRCHTIISGEGVGQYPSLAIVNGWDTHIAYYNAGSGDLWYAVSSNEPANCGYWGTDMACYPVSGSTDDTGKYASMYLDADYKFHIAYYNATDKKLMYAVKLASGLGNCGVLGSAQCEEIDSMPQDYHPLGISISEDPAGYPVIGYQAANGSLKLARPLPALGLPAGAGNCGPGNPFYIWSCDTIDPHGTWITYRNADFVSINVEPSGMAQIAYNGFITGEGGNLRVAFQQYRIFQPLILNKP